jgi:DNA-binding beta-propeller fold protein YncE
MKKPVNLFVVISLVVIGLLIGNGSAWGEIRLYVVNAMDNTVSVIRLSDNTTLATIPLPPAVGIGPIFVALHPSGLKAYVTGDGSTIHIIDTRSNSVVGGVAISENSSSGLAFVPNTNELLVAMEDANVVRRVNTVTDTVVGPAIPTHNQPVDIIVTQDGTKAFVSCMSGGYIEVIDLTVSPPVVSTSINLSSNNLQVIALNPTETLLYVTDAGNQRVRVFRTSDYVEVTPPGYPALQYPRSLSISIDDTRAFVGERVGPIANSVYVIRLSDGMILQNIYDPSTHMDFNQSLSVGIVIPRKSVLSYDGSRLYVTCHGGAHVAVINTTNYSYSYVRVGLAPVGLAIGDVPTPVSVPIFSWPGATALALLLFAAGGLFLRRMRAIQDRFSLPHGR